MDIICSCGFRLLLMLLSTTAVACAIRMLTKGRAYFVNPGQQIQLICEFHSDRFNLFDNPVVWRKTQLDETTQINMMGNLMEPFESSHRFRVTFSSTAPRYTLRLTINDTLLEDSGNYTCEVNGPQNTLLGMATHCLYVRAPIDELQITTESSGIDIVPGYDVTTRVVGSSQLPVLAFIENQPRSVRCVARGGYPVPDVALHLGDRDVTDSFSFRHRLELSAPVTWSSSGSENAKAIRVIRSVATRWSHAFRLATSIGGGGDDGKTLQCVATVAGLEPNYTRVRIAVHFAPIIRCQPTFAEVGERSVCMRCEVQAKPEVVAMFWIIDVNGTTVTQGEVINEYWPLVENLNDGTIETRLCLKQTKPESFRDYTLVAENSIAARTQDVALVPKFPPTTVPDIADSLSDTAAVVSGHQQHRSVVGREVVSPLPSPRSFQTPRSSRKQIVHRPYSTSGSARLLSAWCLVDLVLCGLYLLPYFAELRRTMTLLLAVGTFTVTGNHG